MTHSTSLRAGRPLHGATVETVLDDEGDIGFRATCVETGIDSDAYAYPDPAVWRLLNDDADPEDYEGHAISRALHYLGWVEIHERESPNFCNADHVMEHDRQPRARGRRK